MSARDDMIKGLREMADWLEANPAAPIAPFESARIQHTVDYDAAGLETAHRHLDHIGEQLGLPARMSYGHYGVTKEFGPVRYIAVAIEVADEDEAEDGDE